MWALKESLFEADDDLSQLITKEFAMHEDHD